MREIVSHKVNPANDTLKIEVTDEPGAGGANHRYVVSGFTLPGSPPASVLDNLEIHFQNGPIAEAGVNGITQEVLLAIVIDRLESFQAGAFANNYNARALQHAQKAVDALLDRTRDRMARGVEGQNKL